MAPFLAQRLALLAVATFLGQFLPADRGFHTGLPRVVDMWVRWDAVYYLMVATDGYGGRADAFFPMYPWITAGVATVMPVAVAGVLVANAFALCALCGLYWLVRAEDEAVARRAVVCALLFPTSFFLSAVYPESTFLAFAIGACLCARAGRRLLALCCVACACLARPQGLVALTLPFAIAWLVEDRRWRELPWFVAGAGVAAAALVLVHVSATGDPLAFLHARSVQGMRAFWGEQRPSPAALAVLREEGMGPNLMRRLLNWSALALSAAAAVDLLRRRQWLYAAIILMTVGPPLYFHHSVFDAASMARYTLLAFPVLISMARWTVRSSLLSTALDGSFMALQCGLLALYSGWIWAE